MKKSDLLKFEPQCKMTRPGLSLVCQSPEPNVVKFRDFLYTPYETEPFLIINVDRDVIASTEADIEIPHASKEFFKDPLGEINTDQNDNVQKDNIIEEKPVDPIKLGHNMRACVGPGSRKVKSTSIEVMEARRSLLEKMKDQREAFNKREMAKEDAKILVNQLVAHGFEISHSDEQMRFEVATPLTTGSADFVPSSCNAEAEIVRSINTEIDRVHRFSKVPL